MDDGGVSRWVCYDDGVKGGGEWGYCGSSGGLWDGYGGEWIEDGEGGEEDGCWCLVLTVSVVCGVVGPNNFF